MSRFAFTSAVLILGLAGCNGGGVVSSGATSSSGYATADSSFDTPGDVKTFSQRLITADADSVQVEKVTYQITNTDDPDVKILRLGDRSVTITRDEDYPIFYGEDSNGFAIVLVEGVTTNEQLALAWLDWLEFDLSHPEDAFTALGYIVTGFNTDPAVVDARSGTGSYEGLGAVQVLRYDGYEVFLTYGYGDAELLANFDTGSISGEIFFYEDGGSSPGYEMPVTTAVIEEADIIGNHWSSTVTFDAEALSLDSIDTVELDGMFYEAEATGVGGVFAGSATDDGGTTQAVIQGGFIAEE